MVVTITAATKLTVGALALEPTSRIGFFEELLLKNGFEEVTTDSTVQRDALLWLVNTDPLMMTSEDDEYAIITRFTLVVFYYTLDGPNWSQNDSDEFWLTGEETCNWAGVECSGGAIDDFGYWDAEPDCKYYPFLFACLCR